ncbi:MAG: D-aminoacyl-tRNA deacylase [Myxococcota bacterium]
MRAVAQRVTQARVTVEGEVVGEIGPGLLVYLGAGRGDEERDVDYVARKLVGLRIFPDAEDRMSLSVQDTRGAVLIVSQFTLYGDVRKGRRPSFDAACEPERARELYEQVCERVRGLGVEVSTGRFRASMRVSGDVEGPVTILIDSRKEF